MQKTAPCKAMEKLWKSYGKAMELFGSKCKDAVVTIGNSIIKDSDYEKPFGVSFDRKLSFTKHVEDLCKSQTKN